MNGKARFLYSQKIAEIRKSSIKKINAVNIYLFKGTNRDTSIKHTGIEIIWKWDFRQQEVRS